MERNSAHKLIWGVVFTLAISGLLMPDWMLNHLLIACARALVVLPLMILLRTGLVSFGHALYFSLGAYCVALANRAVGITDIFAVLLAGALTAGLLGFAIGFLVRSHKRIYFAMLNLALSMIFYGAIIKSEFFGSSDGFSIKRGTFFGYSFSDANNARLILFLLLTAIVGLVLLGLDRYMRSTLGRLSEAVRDNDLRVEYLGYSAYWVVHINFTISALLAGLGGAFTALAIGHIDPDSMANWTISGEFVFVAVLSGTGHILAPLFGSLFFELIRTYAYELAPQFWNLIVGGVLLSIILFLPNGISSLFRMVRKGATR
jgi:branched-chain amino acid transport system permease protein